MKALNILIFLFALSAYSAEKELLIKSRTTIMREGPGTFNNKIEQLKKGDKVIFISENGEWNKVKSSSGKSGWISVNAFKEEQSNSKLYTIPDGDSKLQLSSADATASIRGFLEFNANCGATLTKDNVLKINDDLKFLFGEKFLNDFNTFKKTSDLKTLNEKEEALEGLDLATETFLGRAGLNFILLNNKILKNDRMHRYLNVLARVIGDNTSYYDRDFLVVSLDSSDIGAFSIPGGIIFITKGLLKVLANEGQIAALLAHEIAHITRYHGLKMVSTELGSAKSRAEKAMGDEFDKEFANSKNKDGREMLKRVEKELCSIIMEGNKYSQTARAKEDEFEADKYGTIYLYRAGYDPNLMISLINNLDTVTKNNSISAQHPSLKERTSKIENLISDKKMKNFSKNFYSDRYKLQIINNL